MHGGTILDEQGYCQNSIMLSFLHWTDMGKNMKYLMFLQMIRQIRLILKTIVMDICLLWQVFHWGGQIVVELLSRKADLTKKAMIEGSLCYSNQAMARYCSATI